MGAGFEAVVGTALIAAITNGFDGATAGAAFATTSMFLIVVSVMQMGTEVGLVRWLPSYVARGHNSSVRSALAWAATPVAVAAVATSAMCYVMAPALASALVRDGDQAGVAAYVRTLALMIPVAALYQVALAATRGLRTMRPTVLVESVGRNAVQLAAVLFVWRAGLGGASLVLAWSLPYVAAFVAAAIYLTILIRRVERRGSEMTSSATGPRASFAAFWRFTAPRAIASITQVILKRADIVLVAALIGAKEAAIYTAATRFLVLGLLGVQALQQSLAPNLSALFTRRRVDQVRDVFRATTAWTVLMAWPVYLVCVALAPTLLGLFGTAYPEGEAVVVILCLTMLVATACGSVDTVLLMAGRSGLSLANATVTVSVNIALNLLLIPRVGIVGAAISWAIAIVLRNALALFQVKRLLGFSPFGPEVGRAASIALSCFGPSVAIALLTSAGSSTVFVVTLCGAALFAALAWRGRREVRLSDLVGALRPARGTSALTSSLPGSPQPAGVAGSR
jgi:O-antigen/teichoic acid export membrane protein